MRILCARAGGRATRDTRGVGICNSLENAYCPASRTRVSRASVSLRRHRSTSFDELRGCGYRSARETRRETRRGEKTGAEIGEASIHISIIVPPDNSKTEEKWNKNGSLKDRTVRPLPIQALPVHGTKIKRIKKKKQKTKIKNKKKT